eukprot:4820653-Pleurochrysis_carterae.AAC.7
MRAFELACFEAKSYRELGCMATEPQRPFGTRRPRGRRAGCGGRLACRRAAVGGAKLHICH